MRKKISLIGAGGLASEILSFFGKNIEYLYDGTILEPYTRYGKTVNNKFKKSNIYAIGIGYPEIKRRAINSICEKINWSYPLIHKCATIGDNVFVDVGSIVFPKAVLTANIKIEKLATINSNVVIGHDCKIGEMFHASAGAVISGNVTIGDRVFLGANSTIKEKISICSDVVIGAGSVVIRDIIEPGTYAGNPIRKL